MTILPIPAFDEHRTVCAQCNKSPYDLCEIGANMLIADLPKSWHAHPLMAWSAKELAGYVAGLLRKPCSKCGTKLVKRWDFDLDVLCPQRLTLPRDEAVNHDYFPVDTGPFSLGRRVD